MNPFAIDRKQSPFLFSGPGVSSRKAGEVRESSGPAKTADSSKNSQNALESGDLASNGLYPELQSVDAAVKSHEKVHLSILGGYAKGTIHYDYIMLANGEKFAVGGSVGVDTKPVPGDPEATIRKARIIRSAALGPNDPSGPDQQIAAEAYRMEMQARKELKKRDEEKESPGNEVLQTAGILPGAAAGEMPVSNDTLPVPGDPAATIRKARTLRREVMQGELSARDRELVVKSYLMEMRARRELQAGKESSPGKGVDVYA